MQVHFARRGNHAFGDDVAAHDPTENVDQDAFNVGIPEDDLERRRDAFLGGAAADIEEVGRRRAVELDDVHGGHGEARAVHHAADLAVELDVVERVLAGFGLGRILLVEVAQRLQFGVPVERVVVEGHLGVERDHLAPRRDHEWVDLDQRAVEFGEGPVKVADQRHEGAHLLAGKPKGKGKLAALVALEAGCGVDRLRDDLLGRLVRHRFDVHAAFGRGDDGDPACGAVDEHRDIELALDVAAFLDIEALDRPADRSGLLGDQFVAKHGGGVGADLVDGLGEAHAPLAAGIVLEPALAPTTGMDLGLHDGDRLAQFAGNVHGLVLGIGDATLEEGDGVLGQQDFGLILVDVHGVLSLCYAVQEACKTSWL